MLSSSSREMLDPSNLNCGGKLWFGTRSPFGPRRPTGATIRSTPNIRFGFSWLYTMFRAAGEISTRRSVAKADLAIRAHTRIGVPPPLAFLLAQSVAAFLPHDVSSKV